MKKPELNDVITWTLFIILIATTIYMRHTGSYNTTIYECEVLWNTTNPYNFTGGILQ